MDDRGLQNLTLSYERGHVQSPIKLLQWNLGDIMDRNFSILALNSLRFHGGFWERRGTEIQ